MVVEGWEEEDGEKDTTMLAAATTRWRMPATAEEEALGALTRSPSRPWECFGRVASEMHPQTQAQQ